MLGAVRVIAQQNDFSARCHDKDHPDHPLLKGREVALAPNQKGGGKEGGGDRADLDRPAIGLPAQRIGCDYSEPSDLSDRQIDKDDPALKDELAQWYMRRKYQQPGEKRR